MAGVVFRAVRYGLLRERLAMDAFSPSARHLRSRGFWLRSGTALICYSIYAGFYGYYEWSRQLFDGQIYLFAYHCLHNLQSILTIVLPLFLFYKFVDPYQTSFYGMAPKRKGLVLYALLLALMIPLITLASFQPDFWNPTRHIAIRTPTNFRRTRMGDGLIYELCYGWISYRRNCFSGAFWSLAWTAYWGRARCYQWLSGIVRFTSDDLWRGCFVTIWRVSAGRSGPEHPQHLGRLAHSHRHCLGHGNCRFFAGSGAVMDYDFLLCWNFNIHPCTTA